MFSLFRKLDDHPLLATIVMVGATCAYGLFTGAQIAHAKEAYDVRPRCYLVAYQRQGKPLVSTQDSLNNSTVCVPGAPGSRQVIEAIQAQLRTTELASKKPASVVILNILLAEETQNGKRNRT